MHDDYQDNLPAAKEKKSALIHEICKQNTELYFEHMDPIRIIFPYCWKL